MNPVDVIAPELQVILLLIIPPPIVVVFINTNVAAPLQFVPIVTVPRQFMLKAPDHVVVVDAPDCNVPVPYRSLVSVIVFPDADELILTHAFVVAPITLVFSVHDVLNTNEFPDVTTTADASTVKVPVP